jgi:uncharacterized protein
MSVSDSGEQIRHDPFTITTSDGEILWCDARYPAAAVDPVPTIVFIHGFKGFKDWGSIPYICESLARRGFYAVSFNFSHNGVEGNSMEFTRLDKFEHNTFSREVRELTEVIAAIDAGHIPDPEIARRDRIGVIGHSRGGGISLLAADRDRRIGAVAVWASVADYNRYSEAQKLRWRRDGVFETKNMRTGQIMRLGLGLLDDLERNAEALDIGRAARELGRPLLILHGEQDLSVRIEDGERLAALGDPSMTELERFPHTGHTFGAVHPFAGTNDVLEHAIERTASFFNMNLGTQHDQAR